MVRVDGPGSASSPSSSSSGGRQLGRFTAYRLQECSMAFTRVSEIKPWIVDFLLTDNPQTSGKKLHVLKYVSGPHEDGSIVKAATDLDVSITVRFTAHALAVFTETVDSESPDTHEEFNRAFIILRKYWSAHNPQSDKDSSHFEIVIDDFSLWMNETGLRLKVEPMPCMKVREVKEKSNRLWTEWKSRQSSQRDSAIDEEENETGTSQNGGEPSMSSIRLSQLLDQMGVSSSTAADQEKENVRGGVFTGKQRLSLLAPSDLPVQLPANVDASLLHISQDQQNQLSNIPEWQTGYRPPAVSYVSSTPSTENSAAKNSAAPQNSHEDNSLSRPALPDRPWRRATPDNSFRVLGTLTSMQSNNDRVATSDMGTGTYGIDVAIQVGESMLGKLSTGVARHTEIAAQVGDSLLNQHVSDSQSQYVSESQCDFQSQCAFDEVTKVSHNSDNADSSSKSSLDSVIEVDFPGSCNDQITDTQGQRVVSSREESSETSNSAGSKSKKSDSRTSRRRDISGDTNSDGESFVTEDSLEENGLAGDVGDYTPRLRLSCSPESIRASPVTVQSSRSSETIQSSRKNETIQSSRKSLRRSASASSIDKEQSKKHSKSIDDSYDNSMKLGQVQLLRSVDSSDGDYRRSPRLQVPTPELVQVQRLRSDNTSDGDHRRSPRRQVETPELVQVQRLRSNNSSEGDSRRSPRLQPLAAPEHGQVQHLRSDNSFDGDSRRSPRQKQVDAPELSQAQRLRSDNSADGDSRRSPRQKIVDAPELSQVQRLRSDNSSDGDSRRSPRQKQVDAPELSQVQRLRSGNSSDGDSRRSPRQKIVDAPELSQVQRLRSDNSTDGDGRRSPRLQPVTAPEHGQVQRLRSECSSDAHPRRSPRAEQVAAPEKESPLGRSRKVAVLKDVTMQRSSPRNRQEIDEIFAESEDIIMPTPPKVARSKGFSPLRPLSTRSSQKNYISPLVDLKGTRSSLKTPVTFEGEVSVHQAYDDTPRNLDKQLEAVDTSASAKAAASPRRVSRRDTEVSVSKQQEIEVVTPSTGEEISPARPDHISPTSPSDAIATIEETEMDSTPSRHIDEISPSPRISARKSVTQGPYHSTQRSPETTRELPQPQLSPIKTQDRGPIDIRKKRESLGRRETRGSTPRSAGDISSATESSQGSGTEESRRPSRKSKTTDSEKITVVSSLPETTDSPRSSNRSSVEEIIPAPPEKSSIIHKAPTDAPKMVACVSVERLELSKYKSSSSGSVIINDAVPVPQTEAPEKESQTITPDSNLVTRHKTRSQEAVIDISDDSAKRTTRTDAPQKESQTITAGSNLGTRHRTRSQEAVIDISDDSAKRTTRRTVSDKTEEIEDIKVPEKSPHLSVTPGRVVGRTRRSELQATPHEDDSKESNKSPHLSVTHGRRIGRPCRSTSQEDSPVFVSRKDKLNVTRQSPHRTRVYKYSSSPSGSSSPDSEAEDGVKTPVRTRSKSSSGTPFTPQSAEQRRHTRNNSSSSPVHVNQFYRGSPNSPRWRSLRVPTYLSLKTKDVHGKDKSQKSGTPTDKSPASKTARSYKHKSPADRPLSRTPQRKFNVTRKSPRQSQVPENSSTATSGGDEQSDAPVGKVSTRTSKTPQKRLEAEDSRSTSRESVSTSTQRKVGSRHIKKVPYVPSDDDSSIVEIDDGAKTQSDDEDFEPDSPHIKKKCQGATYEKAPSRRRGKLRKSLTQPDTPNHQSERDGRLQKTTPRRTPRAFKPSPTRAAYEDTFSTSSESVPTEVHRKVRQRHNRKHVIPTSAKVPREPLNGEASTAEGDDDSSIEEIDDGAKTQSEDEDYEPGSTSNNRKKAKDATYARTPSNKRGRPRKSSTQPDTPKHQSEKVDDDSSIEEIDDGAKTQSEDEDYEPGSTTSKKKGKDATYARTPSNKRGRPRKSSTQIDTPKHQSENVGQKPKKTPQRTPRMHKAPQKEVQSEVSVQPLPKPRHRMRLKQSDDETSVAEINAETQSDDNDDISAASGNKSEESPEDRPVMRMRVWIQQLPESRFRMRLKQSDDESDDDDVKTQSGDEDCPSASSGIKSKSENKTPVTKRRKLRTSESEVESLSEKQSKKQAPSHTTKPTPSKSSRAAVKLSVDDSSTEEDDDEEEEETQSGDEDYVPESNVKGKKADGRKPVSTKRKRQHHEPSPQKNLAKSKRSAKSQYVEETEEDSENEKASDDDDFQPSPRKKIKAQNRQRPTVRQKRLQATKESIGETSEDETNEEDEDFNPDDHEDDEDYIPSPGTKLRLPLVGKSTRRHQDRTKLSLAKKTAAQPRKKKAGIKRLNATIAESGRIEILQEKTVTHNLSAIFSASKKPATSKLKPSSSRKRKLFSEQTLLGELLPEVQEESAKPEKGSKLRLNIASPLKPLLPKLSGRRHVYDISDENDLVAQVSDKSSSSIANDESTAHKSSEEQEKGTTENINSPLLDSGVEEEGEPFSMTTPVSSLPSHQPVIRDSSPEESLEGSVEQQKEDIATTTDKEATTTAEEQDDLDAVESIPVAQMKASSSPGEMFPVSTPASSLPSHQPVQRGEEPASLKDTPIRKEIQLILSTLPKDPPVGAASPLTDIDMPPDLIRKMSNYFAEDEFA